MKKKIGIYIFLCIIQWLEEMKKKSEENGFQIFYSVKLKKINFCKFILVYWRMKKNQINKLD